MLLLLILWLLWILKMLLLTSEITLNEIKAEISEKYKHAVKITIKDFLASNLKNRTIYKTKKNGTDDIEYSYLIINLSDLQKLKKHI